MCDVIFLVRLQGKFDIDHSETVCYWLCDGTGVRHRPTSCLRSRW